MTAALFVATWACVHQLGFYLGALRVNRAAAAALCAAGLVSLAALASVGPYPAAMVGSSADAMSNMGPPNLMVIALAAFQLGALCAAAPAITAFAARHRSPLEVVSAWAMPTYVWHLTAFCVFFAAAHTAGIANDTIDAGWWAMRPLWLAGPALVCVALLAALVRLGVVTAPTGQRVAPGAE